MRRGRLAGWLALTALWAAGCATSAPIEPGDAVALGSSEGMLVVHVRTNRPIASIFASGVQAAEDVPEGTHVRLIRVSAGRYRWSEIRLRSVAFGFRRSPRLRFRVEPGAINYVGMIDIDHASEFSVTMDSIDRAAIALEDLRKLYPGLVAKYPIVYSGPGHHAFLPRWVRAANGGAR